MVRMNRRPSFLGVVLAAGSGTRLSPLTNRIPKPALPWVPQRSIFEGAVALLVDAGAEAIACNVHHLADSMMRHASECTLADIDVRFETSLRGPAGSLRTFHDLLQRHAAALVVSGDVAYDGSLQRMIVDHLASDALLTIGVTQVEDGSRFGVFETDDRGRVVAFAEKSPAYRGRRSAVSSGIYAASPELLSFLDEDRPNDFLADVLPRLHLESQLRLHPLSGNWSDLGTPQDYIAQLLRQVREHEVPSGGHGARVWRGEGATISERAELYGGVFVGRNAAILGGAEVRDSVVLDGAIVHPGQVIVGGIVGANS